MQGPRGTQDLLPGVVELWQFVESKARDICARYNYREVRTPIFEHTELFQRGVGDTTDIVEKEMYTFADRKNRSLTLRPEGTASVVRSYVEHKLYSSPDVNKLYYIGPMFRYEKPQAGRMRQFHQFGVEALGTIDPSIDAEIIAMAMQFYTELGLRDLALEINSVGCPVCREGHRTLMQAHLSDVADRLCNDCQGRLHRNPMRILDCKNESCQLLIADAPVMLDHLCDECRDHFDKLKSYLDALGISYTVNPRMVRGLDYYTKTAFEIIEERIGAKSTICGGGRYDRLVSSIGGPDKPGIGFAGGIERALLALETQGVQVPVETAIDYFVIGLSEEAEATVVRLVQDLRKLGYRADKDYMPRGLKAQMKMADRLTAKHVVLIGEDELAKQAVTVKYMDTGVQETIPVDRLTTISPGNGRGVQ